MGISLDTIFSVLLIIGVVATAVGFWYIVSIVIEDTTYLNEYWTEGSVATLEIMAILHLLFVRNSWESASWWFLGISWSIMAIMAMCYAVFLAVEKTISESLPKH